jgi:hypothetical protein
MNVNLENRVADAFSPQGFLPKLHAFVQGRVCRLKRRESFAEQAAITFPIEGYDRDVVGTCQHNPSDIMRRGRSGCEFDAEANVHQVMFLSCNWHAARIFGSRERSTSPVALTQG